MPGSLPEFLMTNNIGAAHCATLLEHGLTKEHEKIRRATEIGQEDNIEQRKRSTAETEEKINAAKILCGIETHERMKGRLTMRLTSSR